MPGFIQQQDGSFALQGEMTYANVPALVTHSGAWLASASNVVTIDMAGITRADSAGLALMLEWMKQAGEAGMEIRFFNIPDHLTRLIRVSGLSKVIS